MTAVLNTSPRAASVVTPFVIPADRERSSLGASRPSKPAAAPYWHREMTKLDEVDVRYDKDLGILWHFMAPRRRPSFTLELLRDMTRVLDLVEVAAQDDAAVDQPVRYLVLASRMPGIFNLGGDLELFGRLIEERDREGLRHYAHLCVAGQFRRAVNLNLPIHTICLVQGDALGGGFEAALSHDVIVAERGTKLGLPEVLFNMFPGIGRLQLPLAPSRSRQGATHDPQWPALHGRGAVRPGGRGYPRQPR